MNCYLVPGTTGFIIIDTGTPEKRAAVDSALEKAGCGLGDLRLIVLTHGDYDHAGNAAYLREEHDAPVALHPEDWARVEHGNWELGFKPRPDRFALPFRLVSRFVRPGEFTVFEPDVALVDGQSLIDYGVDATILHLPGHTRGSTGVLLADGSLVCGDLMDSMMRPGLHFFIDDMAAAKTSLTKLDGLGVGMVYPGHGKPFPWEKVRRLVSQ